MRYSFRILIRILLSAFLTTLPAFAVYASPTVSLIPSSDMVMPEETVTLTIRINVDGTGSTLGAYSFDLSWNIDDCTFLSIAGGDAPFSTVNYNLPSTKPGHVLFNQYSVTGATGTVDIAQVTFQITGTPGDNVEWNLAIKSLTAIADENFSDLSPGATVTDGTVTILGTRHINGSVQDLNSGQPINQVSVVLTPDNHSAVTNSLGQFSLSDIPVGDIYTLTATADGYQTSVISFLVPYLQAPFELSVEMADISTPVVNAVDAELGPYQVIGEHEELYIDASVSVTAGQGMTINASEAFIDDDPGTGNGTVLFAVDGQFDETSEGVNGILDLIGYSSGGHQVFIRAQNSAGNWGNATSVLFSNGYDIASPGHVTHTAVAPGPPRTIEVNWELSDSEITDAVSWYRVFRSRLTTFGSVIHGSEIDTIEERHQFEQHMVVLIDSVAAGISAYLDTDIPQDITSYSYWVQAAGSSGVSPLVRAENSVGVTDDYPSSWLIRAYPNPFNPQTTLSYSVATAGQVRIDVYGITGSLVRTLINEYRSAGMHEELWDGRDGSGNTVASGMYVYSLRSGEVHLQGKMLLLK